VLYQDGVEIGASRKRLGLAKTYTVYEGEGIGGALGLGLLWQERDVAGEVTLAVDSTAATHASQIPRPGPSHWIWDMWDSYAQMVLQKHPNARITVRWTPGHRGIAGNERADKEAKKAAQDGDTGKIPKTFQGAMPWSRSARLQTYNADMKAAVASEWVRSPCYQHMKRHDSSLPSKKFVELAMGLPCKLAVILFQLHTGHTILNKHLH
jgi:hypothetical protein